MRLVSHDYQFKIVVTGDSNVGKTCIVKRFLDEFYSKNQSATISVGFIEKDYKINDHNILLHIWDTAGQERFRAVSKSYYRNSIGIVIVFDISNRSSFENLPSWLADAKIMAPPNASITIVGNKSDLPDDQWRVSKKELEQFAKDNDCKCLLTSAHNDLNVNRIFYEIAEDVLNKIIAGTININDLGYSGVHIYCKDKLNIQSSEIEIKRGNCFC